MRGSRLDARVLVCALGGALLAGALWTGAARAEEPSRGGMRAYVDPKTGELLPAPPAPAKPAVPQAASRSSVGLVEEVAPGGGSMVRLQGRFQSPMVATSSVDGAPHAECHTSGDAH